MLAGASDAERATWLGWAQPLAVAAVNAAAASHPRTAMATPSFGDEDAEGRCGVHPESTEGSVALSATDPSVAGQEAVTGAAVRSTTSVASVASVSPSDVGWRTNL